MAKYILKRVLITIVTIAVLIVFTFFAMKLIPGDPFNSATINEDIYEQLMHTYGLDKPVFLQFLVYIGSLLRGDLGVSITYRGREIWEFIVEAFPISMDLGLRALIFSLLVGIGLGVVAALNRNKPLDYLSITIAVIGISVPSFVFASLLQYFLAYKLELFPIARWTNELSKILPTLALSLPTLARFTRMMRTSMLDVIGSDYVKTAKAKGLDKKSIVLRHELRNAILPIVTILGTTTASLLTGSFVVESIFSIPGIGKYFVDSVNNLDYPLIMGLTIFYGSFLVIMNLLVDILYGFIDPRIKV